MSVKVHIASYSLKVFLLARYLQNNCDHLEGRTENEQIKTQI